MIILDFRFRKSLKKVALPKLSLQCLFPLTAFADTVEQVETKTRYPASPESGFIGFREELIEVEITNPKRYKGVAAKSYLDRQVRSALCPT